MASLKELRSRKKSVQSTKKITSAMKMIAVAKMRHATSQVQAARPYAEGLKEVLTQLLLRQSNLSLPLLTGTGTQERHLVIVATSDRGLCGGFNGGIIRHLEKHLQELKAQGKSWKILFVGRKGYDILKRKQEKQTLKVLSAYGKPLYRDAQKISEDLIELLENQEFDVCSIVYNKFISALNQIPSLDQLIPVARPQPKTENESTDSTSLYEFEPNEEMILASLLPQNLSFQIYMALLENAASEHGARMTAMDSATRNAEDMIKKLTLTYNRTRQAYITKELIEIISGAEAL